MELIKAKLSSRGRLVAFDAQMMMIWNTVMPKSSKISDQSQHFSSQFLKYFFDLIQIVFDAEVNLRANVD